MNKELSANKTLSHYRIISKLGAGGMGEVYLAQDTKLDRRVALKILPADVAADQTRMRRFVQEAKAASALNHPNIITIHEIEQIDSMSFITTEFIDGETLRQRMRHAPMKLSEVLDVAIQCASALSAAHATGIVHRDFKPENIMIRFDGIVKVLDFGLAKLTERLSPDSVDTEAPTNFKTSPGTVIGTVAYMAPEQARGNEIDARADIWSLGVVLYELVAGCLPFAGPTSNEVLASVLGDHETQPIARYARYTPTELERIILKALRKNREERYQTIKDMLLDLRSLKQRLEFEAELERSAASHAEKTAQPSAPGRQISDALTAPGAEYAAAGSKRRRRGVLVGLSALLLAVAGAAYLFYFAGTAKTIDSIAVLPLVNASNDPNTEYLSDGITESIISNLSQLPRLRVMARATVFRFKGQEIDPKEVGRQLGVQAVLMGRLLQQGERLVIRTELVNVADGTQLWGAEYDRKLSDVLAVQHDISREISENLRLRLTGEEQRRLTRRDTANAEAYQFYLRGRYFWNKRTGDAIKKAIEQFQQAIERDPNYALGYVGLADCYILQELVADFPSTEILPKARAAVDRALQIDDSLAEAHTSSARIYQSLWRWAEAEEEFKRAISLNPNYPTAHLWFAVYLRIRQQYDDAMRENKRAQELDPLSPTISRQVGAAYLLKDDINSAIEHCQKTIELDPSFHLAHETLGWAYLKQRRYEEAVAEFQRAVELSGRASSMLSFLGHSYAVSGRRAEARAVLKELDEKYARREAVGQDQAGVYAGLGEKDQAFEWLERDFEQRSGQLPFITYWFSFEVLRSDPRYTDLVRRMGLTP
jgi:eukaryotic-like serine/threonine-protein kinase